MISLVITRCSRAATATKADKRYEIICVCETINEQAY